MRWGSRLLADPSTPQRDLIHGSAANVRSIVRSADPANDTDSSTHAELAWKLVLKADDPHALAIVGYRVGRYKLLVRRGAEAIPILETALKATERIRTSPGRDALAQSLLLTYAWALRDAGHFAKAQPLYEAALRSPSVRSDPMVLAPVLSDLGLCLEKAGRLDDAGAMYQEAARLATLHGSDQAATIRANLESFRKARGEVARASPVQVDGSGIRMPP